jgi:hypothetical protein
LQDSFWPPPPRRLVLAAFRLEVSRLRPLRHRPRPRMHRKARKPRKHQNMSSGPRSSSPRLRRAGPRRATPRRPGRGLPGRPGRIGPLPGPRARDLQDLWPGDRHTCRGTRGRTACATGSRASSAHCTGTASIGSIAKAKRAPRVRIRRARFSLRKAGPGDRLPANPYCVTVCTTLLIGRLATAGTFWSFTSIASYSGRVSSCSLAFICTTL